MQDHKARLRRFGQRHSSGQNLCPVFTGQSAHAHNDDRGFLGDVGMILFQQFVQQRRAVAQMVVVIGQIDSGAHQGDVSPTRPGFTDTRVKHRCFHGGVCADQHDGLCRVQIFDRGGSDIARPVARRQLRAIGTAFHNAALPFDQLFQCICSLDRRKVTDQTGNILTLHRSSGSGQCFGPISFAQLTVFANIGRVQTLTAQTVPDETGFIGNPFLVHAVVVARQKAHDFAAFGIHTDVRPKRIHHINRFCLGQFPRPCGEGVGFRDQRPHGAQVNDITLQVRIERLPQIGCNLGVFTTAGLAHLVNARDLGGEAYTTGARDAARHMGFNQRAQIQIFGRALRLAVAAKVDAVRHRLILQVTLAALIADRAIQRVVDQQEFHHALAGLFHHGRIGFNDRRLAFGARPQIAHLHGARRRRLGRAAYDLHKTHPAVTGNRQTFVVTETRNFHPCFLTRLNERHRPFDFDFLAVNDDLAGIAHMLISLSVTNRSGSIFGFLHALTHNSFVGQKYRPPSPLNMQPPGPSCAPFQHRFCGRRQFRPTYSPKIWPCFAHCSDS